MFDWELTDSVVLYTPGNGEVKGLASVQDSIRTLEQMGESLSLVRTIETSSGQIGAEAHWCYQINPTPLCRSRSLRIEQMEGSLASVCIIVIGR